METRPTPSASTPRQARHCKQRSHLRRRHGPWRRIERHGPLRGEQRHRQHWHGVYLRVHDIGGFGERLADYGGLSSPEEILILGSDIFVTNFGTGIVGEYTTSGGIVNASLITGLDGPDGIATDGTNLYITNALGDTVSEYTTSGALVNAALISGLDTPTGIAVVPTATPEPGGFGLVAVALAGLGFLRRKRAASRS